MGVTIDSIQIEIQSSSNNAAQGIDALAKALEGLKKNGSFKTVTTNLNHLSQSLKGLQNVYQASNSLRTLANSIEKLKGVGTISSLSNSLAKLPVALKSLGSIDLDRVAPQIKSIVDALAPLSSVKSGGFGTLVNSLKNIGDVTTKLDDKTIEAFTKKIALLNEKLGPFAEKMANVKSAFSAINSNARSAASSVDSFGKEVDTAALNMSSIIEVGRGVIDTLRNAIVKFKEFMDAAIEWDGIAARFGRGFGTQARETYEWIQRLNEEMGINVQQFMQYSSVYATMLTGFGVANADASKMALGYAELTYDIWAGYNDIYRTFDEAAEAVRSAIAGEVEPVRRAGFTIIESTLEQTAANHGLEISLANATEAQKSYLRYLTLVDQAHAQGLVGTYAKEMDTAEGLMRTFAQQLKSLSQAFGSLFLPILVRVMPYLQAFVELLAEGVRWIASLFGIELQAVDFSGYEAGAGAIENVADSAGSATDALNSATKAAKELKNATIGIDELNVISPSSATGAGGVGSGGGSGGSGGNGFAGLDIDSLWDESILDGISQDVDAIKEKMRGWMPIIASVAAALGGLSLLKLVGDLKKVQDDFKSLSTLITPLGDLGKKFTGFVTAFVQLAKEFGFVAALTAAFPKLSAAISTFVGNLGAFIALAKEFGFIQALAAAFPKLAAAIGAISAPAWAGIAAAILAIASAAYFLYENWEKVVDVVKRFWDENIVPKLEEIKKHFDNMKVALEPLAPLFEWLGVAFDFIVKAGLKIIEVLGGIVFALVSMPFAAVFQVAVGVIENAVQMLSGFIQTVVGWYELIVAIFTGGDIEAAWQKIWDGAVDYYSGLVGLIIDPVVDLVTSIIDWFVYLWDELVGHSIIPDTIDSIVDWFLGLPGKVLGSVGTFVNDVIGKFANLGKSLSDKFSSAWESVKTWWSKKPALTSYVPTIGSIKDKLSSAWTAAKDWWNKNRSSLSYTPTIGKIWEKLKGAWTSAKDWWNKSRSNLSYTPSIGSISSKLSSAWTSAKNWWNKNRSSLSYTPSIGSIKDKIVSAWNTAKKWWSSNASLSTKLNVSVPKITVKWDTASAFGKSFKYPTGFSLKFAANGGIFDQGSLIWAGERGPEVMARAAGGKTGVMNVQQMQDAVYEGVYSAVVAAMKGVGGGGNQNVNVYLDGKQITSAVERRQHEQGASIMGNEVYSY